MKVSRQCSKRYTERMSSLVNLGWDTVDYPSGWLYFGTACVAGRYHEYAICEVHPGVWLVEVTIQNMYSYQRGTWEDGRQLFAYALCTNDEVSRLVARRASCPGFVLDNVISSQAHFKEVAQAVPQVMALVLAKELECG